MPGRTSILRITSFATCEGRVPDREPHERARHGAAADIRRPHRAPADKLRTESDPELRLRDAEWWRARRLEFRSGLERRSAGCAFRRRQLSAGSGCGYLGADGAAEGRNVPPERVDQDRWPW